jgi:hypothetical protein
MGFEQQQEQQDLVVVYNPRHNPRHPYKSGTICDTTRDTTCDTTRDTTCT